MSECIYFFFFRNSTYIPVQVLDESDVDAVKVVLSGEVLCRGDDGIALDQLEADRPGVTLGQDTVDADESSVGESVSLSFWRVVDVTCLLYRIHVSLLRIYQT